MDTHGFELHKGVTSPSLLSTLTVMNLHMVKNECVGFGGHVDIEVSFKILQLGILKETPILHNLSCYE